MLPAKFNKSLIFSKLKSNLSLRKHVTHRKLYLSEKRSSVTNKYTVELLPELTDSFESGQFKYKSHPGQTKSECVSLPEKLKAAALRVLSLHSEKNILLDSHQFHRKLFSKCLPMEYEEIQTRTTELIKKMNVPISDNFTDEDLTKEQTFLIKRSLAREVNRWKPTLYTEYNCLVYMMARLSANYACLHSVFSEISRHQTTFEPKTFFDFGAGVGTALWAAHYFWGKRIREYFCIDTSSEMNSLCQLLLRGGKEEQDMFLKDVYFRQFLPGSDKLRYDLVIVAFSLLELTSAQERIRVIDTLWQKTNDTMVIIEHGSTNGFSAVLEARDYILKLHNKSGNSSAVSIIAPCPHKLSCPKFGGKWPCHFEVCYHPFYPERDCNTIEKDLFSYVVLKKGPLTSRFESWPRVTEPTKKRSKLVNCHLCCSDGKIHNMIITKSRHGKHAYQCARYTSHGDLLPVKVIPKEPCTKNEKYECEDL